MILLKSDDLKSFSAKKNSSAILTTVVARTIDFCMPASPLSAFLWCGMAFLFLANTSFHTETLILG